ncbi:MAG: anti-sigma factor antagonist [Anaerolineales bacterium]|jgi:anti-sigma B factor antagonist
MEYRIETVQEITVLRLKGALDHSTRGTMEMKLLSLVSYGRKLLFDLAEVDYISSAGLHLLLDLYRRSKQYNATIALSGPSEQTQSLLAITGFAKSGIAIYETFEEGLSALRTDPKPDTGSRGISDENIFSDLEPAYGIPKMEEKEEVNFSAFYPKEVTVEKWYTLLVYTYVPSVLETVREDARKFEDEIGDIHESKPATTTQLTRGTEVTIVPICEGVTFNPERVTFQWLEDQHRAQFRLQADASMADLAGVAQVTIYVGPLIVGTLKMGILFTETETGSESVRSEEVSGQMYQQDDIFISYSHHDTEIINICKKAYEALGHNVLIDFETLRSGQKWNAELMRMIDRASIFQLFWSENSSKSAYCRQEWEYALKLNRGEGFIRPVFWKEPIPNPPVELSDIHFDFAPFSVED